MRQPLDWRDHSVARNQAMRDLEAMAWAPRSALNFRALGWSLIILVIFAFLMGMLVVGS